MWGQILRLCNPLDELRRCHPNEADELQEISRALDSAGVTNSSHLHPSSDGTPQSLEAIAQAHRRLAEKYDHILARIRSLPDFTEFLQPEKFTSNGRCRARTGCVLFSRGQKSPKEQQALLLLFSPLCRANTDATSSLLYPLCAS